MTVPTLNEAPPPLPPAQTPNATTIELMCVGNAGNGYINAQIMVTWFEVLVNHEKKHVEVTGHNIPIKRYRREQRVNFCEFDIPDGAVCHVYRHIQTRPDIQEMKFYKLQDGKFVPLADGCAADFSRFFLSDFKGYSFQMTL